jgi:hypothetical protein
VANCHLPLIEFLRHFEVFNLDPKPLESNFQNVLENAQKTESNYGSPLGLHKFEKMPRKI